MGRRRSVVLVAHDIRSAHNIGSLMRTAEGLGANRMIITGYSPYPKLAADRRLPHIAAKVAARIHKTALGAENHLDWTYEEDALEAVNWLRQAGYTIAALEQAEGSIKLMAYQPPDKLAVIAGSETAGIDRKILDLCDVILEIPMAGQKESLNVAVAAGIGLYHLISATGRP